MGRPVHAGGHERGSNAAPTSGPLGGVRRRWAGLSDHGQVGFCLAGMTGLIGLWALLWPVPTEVIGSGVLIYPENAGVLNARAAGQVQSVAVRTGQPVRKGRC